MRAGMRGVVALVVALGGTAEAVAGAGLASGVSNVRAGPDVSVIVAQADTHVVPRKRAIGVCLATEYIAPNGLPIEGQGAIGPNYSAVDYFALYEKQKIALPSFGAVQLIKGPDHGTVAPYRNPGNEIDSWRYVPASGYVGNDSVEFVVDVRGESVHVIYFFKVTKLDIERGAAEGLCKQFEWKEL